MNVAWSYVLRILSEPTTYVASLSLVLAVAIFQPQRANAAAVRAQSSIDVPSICDLLRVVPGLLMPSPPKYASNGIYIQSRTVCLGGEVQTNNCSGSVGGLQPGILANGTHLAVAPVLSGGSGGTGAALVWELTPSGGRYVGSVRSKLMHVIAQISNGKLLVFSGDMRKDGKTMLDTYDVRDRTLVRISEEIGTPDHEIPDEKSRKPPDYDQVDACPHNGQEYIKPGEPMDSAAATLKTLRLGSHVLRVREDTGSDNPVGTIEANGLLYDRQRIDVSLWPNRGNVGSIGIQIGADGDEPGIPAGYGGGLQALLGRLLGSQASDYKFATTISRRSDCPNHTSYLAQRGKLYAYLTEIWTPHDGKTPGMPYYTFVDIYPIKGIGEAGSAVASCYGTLGAADVP